MAKVMAKRDVKQGPKRIGKKWSQVAKHKVKFPNKCGVKKDVKQSQRSMRVSKEGARQSVDVAKGTSRGT